MRLLGWGTASPEVCRRDGLTCQTDALAPAAKITRSRAWGLNPIPTKGVDVLKDCLGLMGRVLIGLLDRLKVCKYRAAWNSKWHILLNTVHHFGQNVKIVRLGGLTRDGISLKSLAQ